MLYSVALYLLLTAFLSIWKQSSLGFFCFLFAFQLLDCWGRPVSYVVFTQKAPSLYYSHDAGTCAWCVHVLTSWYQFNLPRKWWSRCSREWMLPFKGPKITITIFTSDKQRLYDALFYHLITLDCKDGSQSDYFCFVLFRPAFSEKGCWHQIKN